MSELKVKYLMVFEDSQILQHPEKTIITLVQPILRFDVPFIPTQLSFSISTAITGLVPNSAYAFRFVLRSTDGEILFQEDSASVMNNEMAKSAGVVMAFQLRNIQFKKEDAYYVDLYVNSEKVAEQDFVVRKQEQ